MRKKTKPYLVFLILLATAPILSIYWLFWQVKIDQNPNGLILCTLGELMADRHQFCTNLTFYINVSTAVMYICIMVKMKFEKHSSGKRITNF